MANISIRMEDKLKQQAEELFSDLGMNLTTAITIFVKQSLREVEKMKRNPSLGKSFDDVDTMMEDLLK